VVVDDGSHRLDWTECRFRVHFKKSWMFVDPFLDHLSGVTWRIGCVDGDNGQLNAIETLGG